MEKPAHGGYGAFPCGAAVTVVVNRVFRGECALLEVFEPLLRWKRLRVKDSGRLVFHAEARSDEDSLLRSGILRNGELWWGRAALQTEAKTEGRGVGVDPGRSVGMDGCVFAFVSSRVITEGVDHRE